DELAASAVRVAVATTGSRAWVEPLIARVFGRESFEVVVTGDDVERLKPDPAVSIRSVYLVGGVLLMLAAAAGWSGPRRRDR
ncbi:MAG: HAD hydrolase-like protein, partial [Acidimicrobiales bacterium]